MITEVINVFVGPVIGLLSGYFFERRATRSARAHNEELERELAELRHSVLSIGWRASSSGPKGRRRG